MSDTPYTKHRNHQFRGPTSSEDYNSRIEENYLDLVSLYNGLRILGDELDENQSRFIKEMVAVTRELEELKARQDVLDAGSDTLVFYSPEQIDDDRFDSTPYELTETVRLSHDTRHGVITLPEVASSSLSKLAFIDSNNAVIVPSSLEMRVEGLPGTADSAGATIDSNEPEISVARQTGRIWERNVVVNAPDANAQMSVFLKAPTDMFTTDSANCLILHPYPVFGTDIIEVAYTTNPNVLMDDGDGYTPLNEEGIHSGNGLAVGWVPAGGWANDEDLNAGPRVYHFNPKKITGLRIKLRQRHYYKEGGLYVYTYGLTALDLRQNKYLDSGKTLIRFDAPDGDTISDVTNVLPQMYNVPEALYPHVFSYRVLWETAYDSGVYSLAPVPFSNRVWIEVSLEKMPGGGSPALSGLSVQYT